jgi:hypothetical protein
MTMPMPAMPVVATPEMEDPAMQGAVAQPAEQKPEEDYSEEEDQQYGRDPYEGDPIDLKLGDVEENAKLVLAIFQLYEQMRAPMEADWQEAEDLYDGKDVLNAQNWPYSSSYNIPEIWRQTESQKALALQAYFGQPRDFEYKPRFSEGLADAQAATGVVRNQIKRYSLRKQLMDFLTEVFIPGVSYLTYDWHVFKTNKMKITKLGDTEKPSWKREPEEVYVSSPCLEYLDHWKVYCSPFTPNIQDSPYAFVCQRVTGDYLITQVNSNKYDQAAVEKALESGDSADFVEGRQYEFGSEEEQFNEGTFQEIKCYTNGGIEYVILNSKEGPVIVRQRRCVFPEIPIFNLTNYGKPTQHHGKGEPMLLKEDSKLLHDLVSMMVDGAHFGLNPSWLAEEDMRKQLENMFMAPGTIVFGKPGSVQPFPSNVKTDQLMHLIGFVREWMQSQTGMTNEVTGIGSRQRTATGLARLQQAASARIEQKTLYWTPVFEKIYMTLHKLNAAFLNKEYAAEIEGADGKMAYARYVDPTAFNAEVDVEVLLPDTMDAPQEKQAKAMQLLQIAQGNPQINQEPILELLAVAFDIPKRSLIVDPAATQSDALYENEDLLSTGYIADPKPTDDHGLHWRVHTLALRTPEIAANRAARMALTKHMEKHQKYLSQMQQMQAQNQMAAQGAGMGEPGAGQDAGAGVRGEASARTESMFNNGQAGAAQAGAMQQRRQIQ